MRVVFEQVTADREAVLRVTVFETAGQPQETDTIVDTGFADWLKQSLTIDFANGRANNLVQQHFSKEERGCL